MLAKLSQLCLLPSAEAFELCVLHSNPRILKSSEDPAVQDKILQDPQARHISG